MKIFSALFWFCLLPTTAFAENYQAQPNPWSQKTTPIEGEAQAIGFYSNGCQIGAKELPAQGEGYYDIRRYRHRYFTQPITIELIQYIGQNVHHKTGENILIGDTSQPIGGLMSYAHVSHQNGLDVDIYFAAIADTNSPPKDAEIPFVVDKATGKMRMALWKPAYREALYAAANYPQTNRIFVNPIIKAYLCRTEKNTAWLHKIRPWWGHDEHFHVRLNCPASNKNCESQAPIPAGDGCTADIQQWITEQSKAALSHPKPQKSHRQKPRPAPPAICQNLLHSTQQNLSEPLFKDAVN